MIVHAIFVLAILSAATVDGQTLMEGNGPGEPVRLIAADAAIMEDREARTDLDCAVKPMDARLGFDLKFHSGYEVTVPLQKLVGAGNSLTAILRVIAEDHPSQPIYFSQKWSVPPVSEESRGRADLHGAFVLGEGKYQVKWLLRDREERFCSAHWQIVVEPRGKDRQVPLRIARGAVAPDLTDLFAHEAPVEREAREAFHVLVLFHVAPQTPWAVAMGDTETLALLAILRRIAQEPRIGKYSIVAFNLDQNSVLYRREDAAQLDFPELGDALKQLRLGTVAIQTLREKVGEAQFLGSILTEELARSRPDAVIFVGPRTDNSAELRRSLSDFGEPHCSVFYLNYAPDPALVPWRDLIGSLVKLWKGSEYTISKPVDLFRAWTEIVSRLSSRRTPPINTLDSAPITGLVPKK